MSRFTYGMEFEIEGLSPVGAAAALNRGGVDCVRVQEDIHEDEHEAWKSVYDGSLSNGAEVVSPILDDSRLNEASRVARLLSGAGATVGRTTGFHVHVGADVAFGNIAQNLPTFILNYYAAHHAIAALVAPSRLNNRFCPALDRTYAEREAEWIRNGANSSRLGSRYYSLNLDAMQRHGTIEIRLHQGTLNGVKAIAWAQFIASMIDASNAGDDFATIEGFTPWLGVNRSSLDDCRLLINHLTANNWLKPSTGDWLKGRAARLNG